jgi:hypothetical protein
MGQLIKGRRIKGNWKGLLEELRERYLVCSTCSSERIRILIFY